MNNKLSLNKFRFKQFFILAPVVYLLITFLSCSGNDKNTGFVSTAGYILLDSEVIGPTGGDINLDSIIVEVPSGAFNENTELSVYVGEENDGFGEYGSSALFQIAGLPNTINKPIRLNLKYNGVLEGDTLVAVGEMGYAVSLDSSLFSYNTEKAKDSLGYLVYELPAYTSLAKIAGPKNEILDGVLNIIVLSTYVQLLSSDKNFRISVPLPSYQDGIRVGDHFETAFTKCKTIGFSYPIREWPANVMVKPLTYLGCYFTWGANGMSDEQLRSWINKGEFAIRLELLSDDVELRATIGHEFLHLVQNLYEFSSSWIEPEQNWLKEATSVWIEEKFTNVDNFVSSSYGGREHYPFFYGWQNNLKSYSEFGYGLSVIFKEIADTYGDQEIVKIFEKIKSGILPGSAVDPVDAVKSIIEEHEPIDQFWHRTLCDYILGTYYNNKVNFKFLDKPILYDETTPIDKMNIKTTTYHVIVDLSGQLVKVKFGDVSTIKKIPLIFSIDDPTNCGLLVCKFKQGSEIAPIGEVYPGENGIVAIDDVKPLLEDDYGIIVLITNSTNNKDFNYQMTNGVTLTVERFAVINNIEFRIQCEGSYARDTNLYWANPGLDTTYYYDSRATITSFNSAQTIGIQGNTITLSADSTDQSGYTYKTDLELTFNNIEEPSMITSFTCTGITTYTDANTDTKTEKIASGGNIPITNTNNPLRFEVEGNISQSLGDFQDEFTGDFRIYNPRGYDDISLIGYDGSTDGLIRFIIFQGE